MFLLNKRIKAETHFAGRDISAHFGKFKDRSFLKKWLKIIMDSVLHDFHPLILYHSFEFSDQL